MAKANTFKADVKKKADDAAEKEKERVVDKLIKIAINESSQDSEVGGLFHTPDGVAYADIPVHGRRETWPIRSRGFKQWLVRVYYERNETAPNSEALQSAITLAEARANIDGPEREVFVRVGGAHGKIYIDLANKEWQVIEIDATGWRILESKAVLVRFRRAPGMLALPMPVRGGSINLLRPFLNVRSDTHFELAIAWLVAAMRDVGPFPILALVGEHGTAKTAFASTLRSLIDPNTAALRTFPREDRDLFIAASNSWIVGYDNVSHIPAWLSDALCRLSTGGGFSTRKLFTDDEEAIFNAQRPIILNGIEDYVSRPDLADRSTFLMLEQIPEDRRLADRALQAELKKARPKILGALLGVVVTGLRRLPSVKLERVPRMADFAMWATACERVPGAFMAAYDQNRAEAVKTVLEADVVAKAVRAFMALRGGQEWSGTATELLDKLAALYPAETRSRDWPRDSSHLSGRLRRAAPDLRKVGIAVEFDREGGASGGTRIIVIRTIPQPKEEEWEGATVGDETPLFRKTASPASPASQANNDGHKTVTAASPQRHRSVAADGGDGTGDGTEDGSVTSNPLKDNGGDGGDGGDGDLRINGVPDDFGGPDSAGSAPPIPDFLQVHNRKLPYDPDRQCPLGPGGEDDSLDDF
jgi:hypothetical protein